MSRCARPSSTTGWCIDLRKAVAFYVERDTQPDKWYPRDATGHVDKFDDLPAQYRENINMEPPFGGQSGRQAGAVGG